MNNIEDTRIFSDLLFNAVRSNTQFVFEVNEKFFNDTYFGEGVFTNGQYLLSVWVSDMSELGENVVQSEYAAGLYVHFTEHCFSDPSLTIDDISDLVEIAENQYIAGIELHKETLHNVRFLSLDFQFNTRNISSLHLLEEISQELNGVFDELSKIEDIPSNFNQKIIKDELHEWSQIRLSTPISCDSVVECFSKWFVNFNAIKVGGNYLLECNQETRTRYGIARARVIVRSF